jgi:hypothetical protein
MATKKKPDLTPSEPKPNREQRRREKFGRAGGATTEPWPRSEANPAFSRGTDAEEANARTGSATEGAERADDGNGLHEGETQQR